MLPTPIPVVLVVPVQAAPAQATPAQAEPGVRKRPGTPPPVPLDALSWFLEKLYWKPEIHGALVIVDPQALRGKELLALPDDPRGFNLTTLAPAVKRRVAKLGGVTTILPRESVNFSDGARLSGADRDDDANVLTLLANLPDGARANMGSGIGVNDLAGPGGRALFLKTLPDQLSFRGVPEPPALDPNEETSDDETNPENREEALAARLPLIPQSVVQNARIKFRWRWSFQEEDDTTTFRPVRLRPFVRQPDVFSRTPEKAKATDLDTGWDGLNGAVSLAGAKTVRDLIERVARVSRVNLAADPRLSQLSVFVKGDSVRGGDILAALTRAFGGAFRKVTLASGESLFLLAEDRVPLAVRTQSTADIALSAELDKMGVASKQESAIRKLRRRLRADGLAALPVPLPAGLSAESLNRSLKGESLTVPLSAIPVGDRARILFFDAQERKTDPESAAQPPLTEISATIRLEVTVVLPELGESQQITYFDPEELLGDEKDLEPTAPVALPRARTRALRIALPSPGTEISALIGAAKTAGFTDLWVELPAIDPNDPRKVDARFAALAAAAKAAGLGASPTVSVTNAPPGASDALRERDLLGRTATQWAQNSPIARALRGMSPDFARIGGWLAASDSLWPEAVDFGALTKRLKNLAGLPGVTSVALTDCVPGSLQTEIESFDGFLIARAPSPISRRAFLTAERADPLDLVSDLTMMVLSSPDSWERKLTDSPALAHLTRPGQLAGKWQQAQTKYRQEYVAKLVASVAGAGFGVPGASPLRIRRNVSMNGSPMGNWEPWRGAESLMPQIRDENGSSSTVSGSLPTHSPLDLAPLSGNSDSTLMDRPDDERFARSLAREWAPRKDDSGKETPVNVGDGYVIDLTIWSPPESVAFLSRWLRAPLPVKPEPAKPIAPKPAPTKPSPGKPGRG